MSEQTSQVGPDQHRTGPDQDTGPDSQPGPDHKAGPGRQAGLEGQAGHDDRAVAVIGLSCRLPGAPDPEAFWQLLAAGREAIGPVPDGRWDAGDGEAAGLHAGFLPNVADFDAAFFGISPREAVSMDPQQRLLLELAWEALEDAATVPADLRGSRSGVFVGATWGDYAGLLDAHGAESFTQYTMTGTNRAIIANRVSYTLGLQGPSVTIDSAQSSSLVAVHLACESIRSGESAIALAGGVNLILTPESMGRAAAFGGLSPDSRSYTFDARANGFVRGEGGALVVLKSLSAAIADGDRIHCVLRGSAINNDGATDALTVPSGQAQTDVIRAACAAAGVRPAQVQYVELHGTGTKVGDPIEATALGAALRPDGSGEPLLVGSVKTNIGHLEGAAGITGLVKTALSLSRRELPPSLNFETPNPQIPLTELGLSVVDTLAPWPQRPEPLLAGVSSFGMGGTNCHVVLSGPPLTGTPPTPTTQNDSTEDDTARHGITTWTVSGRTPAALRAQARQLHESLSARPELSPAQVATALARTRTEFDHRAVVLGRETGDLLGGLDRLAAGEEHADVVCGRVGDPGPVVFVFPGQGSQWAGMARELLDTSDVFRRQIAACESALAPHVDWSLPAILRAEPSAPALDRVDVVQPTLFAVMVALARVWQSLGLRPAAVVGHSQGEIAAAHIAGALSLDDAARVVALRSQALVALAGTGAMASVPLPAATVEDLLVNLPEVEIATLNGPGSTVVSGTTEAVAELVSRCRADGVQARTIPVDYASHSSRVEPIRGPVLSALAGISPREPVIPFFSTVGGSDPALPGEDTGEATVLDPAYWFRNLRRRVEFQRTIETLARAGHRTFVEISPHPVLLIGLQETLGLQATPDADPLVVGSLRRDEGAWANLLRSAAALYVRGVPLDRPPASPAPTGSPIALPTYPFQRRRFWPDAALTRTGTAAPATTLSQTEVEVDESELTWSERLAGLPAPDRIAEVRTLVRSSVGVVLGYAADETVDEQSTFKDLGFNSLTVVELRNRLVARTQLRLPTTLLYHYPTPAALVRHLGGLVGVDGPATPVATVGAVDNDPIAIVGMACRFPGGANTPQALWQVVTEGLDVSSDFPQGRHWDTGALFDPDPDSAGRTYVSRGGFLHDADQFDPGFFGISPREAVAVDPQQRVLLETSWEAFEHAGIDPHTLHGSGTGVFVGAMATDYGPRLDDASDVSGYLLTGLSGSVVSGRVAYTFGFQGPAVTVDTACSSSLVAMHLAAQSLRQGECSMALAGGVTIMARPGMFIEFSRQRGLAPDGRCKSFSSSADGTAWSEGAGMLVLERLSDAVANGHQVLALVRGSAINQDGASNGLTAPNGPSQERVIRAALAGADLSADQVDVVEAHGTGTGLGDPIEAQALLAAYGQERPADQPLWLGSIKSNIGHSQAAAGVAGVIKMVQAMRHDLLPKTLHIDEPTPHVDWSSGAVALLREARPWPVTDHPRRAGVSSFGISGTNAHLIIEAAPTAVAAASRAEEDRPSPAEVPAVTVAGALNGTPVPGDGAGLIAGHAPEHGVGRSGIVLWPVSGRDPGALAAQAERLHTWAGTQPHSRLSRIAHALATGRSHFEDRAVVLGSSRSDLLDGLAAVAAGRSGPGVITGRTLSGGLAFMFSGQGGQHIGMGAGLYSAFPVFTEALDEVCAAIDPYLDGDLRTVMFTGRTGPDGPVVLDDTGWAQPALFALQVALFRLLTGFGFRPDQLAGHSIGEVSAAHVGGVLDLPDAAALVAARARLMQAAPTGGAMLAIAASEAEITPRLPAGVCLAAVNSPTSVVISGDHEPVHRLADELRQDGHRVQALRVSHAFHSQHMDGVHDDFVRAIAPLGYRSPSVPIVSTLTGQLATSAQLSDPGYWADQLRRPVRYHDAVVTLHGLGVTHFLEAGPHHTLTTLTRESLATRPHHATSTLNHQATVGGTEPRALLTAVADLHAHGHSPVWAAVNEPAGDENDSGHDFFDLPTYAFQHDRFWLAPAHQIRDVGSAGLADPGHPLLGAMVELPGAEGHLFTGRISTSTHPWLADHSICGAAILPATAYLDLGLHVGRLIGAPRLDDLTLNAPLVLPADTPIHLRLRVGAADGTGRHEITVDSRAVTEDAPLAWTRNATGVLTSATETRPTQAPLEAWPPPGAEPIDLTDAYGTLAARGYEYGPAFQGLHSLWRHGSQFLAEVELPAEADDADTAAFGLHPALADAALHAVLLADQETDAGSLLLPFSWAGVGLQLQGARALRARIIPQDNGSTTLILTDTEGAAVATVQALVMRPAPMQALIWRQNGDGGARAPLWRIGWAPVPVPAWAAQTPGCGVLGAEPALVAALTGTGTFADTYPDLKALQVAVMTGSPAPATVVTRFAPLLPGNPAEQAAGAVRAALDLVQSWNGCDDLVNSRLVLLLPDQNDSKDQDGTALAAAAVRGLLRSAQTEHPGRFLLLDVDLPTDHETDRGASETDTTPSSIDVLAAVLADAANTDEEELAITAGRLFAARLERVGPELALAASPQNDDWRIDVTTPGSLDGVGVVANPDAGRAPGPGEVRVSIRAAGINFRDVVLALGLVPEHSVMGLEGAGVVVETGTGVRDLAPGDRVMGLVRGSLGRSAIVDRRALIRIPAGWSDREAASVPVVFLTALYALDDLAGVRAGESILIHAAAGGVGTAATQLARHLGLEVFGTASPAKWATLRGAGFDTEHLASSRSLSFEADLLRATAGRGVDVVLNSLAGDFVDASLRLLPRGGRFVEMGKTDLRDRLEVADAHAGVAYQAFDLLSLDLDRIADLLSRLGPLFDQGILTPPPITSRDVRRAPGALRRLGEGHSIGKLVLTVPAPFAPDGTVLITGGTGSLGARLARHLVSEYGVRNLLLSSRSGAHSPGAGELAGELAELGAAVNVVGCDVADRASVQRLLAAVPAEHPLTAVIHTAGVLADAPVDTLDGERLDAVLAPKVAGAWHLHELTRDLDLSAFVLFSSIAGTLGNAGQANYAAANTFLDELSRYRESCGLASTTVAWGPWTGTGMAAGLDRVHLDRMARTGVLPITPDQGLALFDAAWCGGLPDVLAARLDPGRASVDEIPVIMRALVRDSTTRPAPGRRSAGPANRSTGPSLTERLGPLAPDERHGMLLDLVQGEASAVLSHTGQVVVAAERTFKAAGFDSLTAIELRNRLNSVTGLRLPSSLIFDQPTPGALAGFLTALLLPPELSPADRMLRDLHQLEQVALAATSTRAGEFDLLAGRLEELATRLRAGGSAADEESADVEQRIEAASDDEIFAFIDNELGEV